MNTYLEDMQALSVQNRTFAVLGNGSWAPQSTKLMEAKLKEMKNTRLITDNFTIKSSLKEDHMEALKELAKKIAEELK